jgi:hypothetical protein
MSNPVDQVMKQLKFGPPQAVLSTLPTLAQIKKLAARNKLPPKPQPPAPPPAA